MTSERLLAELQESRVLRVLRQLPPYVQSSEEKVFPHTFKKTIQVFINAFPSLIILPW